MTESLIKLLMTEFVGKGTSTPNSLLFNIVLTPIFSFKTIGFAKTVSVVLTLLECFAGNCIASFVIGAKTS